MTLPASGPISFNAINIELGQSGTTTADINQTSYRTLASVPSGTISLSNFYGKSNIFTFYISSDQTNADFRSLAISAGWNQSTKLQGIINSGIVVSANSTGAYGLTISGSYPNGVTLVNNGYIIGQGGNGSQAGDASSGSPAAGLAGGPALLIQSYITINNASGTIGGGGGGGGSGGYDENGGGSGGGGGGRTGRTNSYGIGPNDGGGYWSGSAGGTGTFSGAGGGGAGGGAGNFYQGYPGGAGGNWGASGASGIYPQYGGQSPGGGGAATSGNGYVTWSSLGTIYGPRN